MVTITEQFRNDTTTVRSEGADLVWERVFDAPRELVWRAFMDPQRIPRWWGPHGSTATVVEMDVRPGGTWRFISRAPGRDDVPFTGEYLEIDPPASFRQTFIVDIDGMREHVGIESFSFVEIDGKTKLTSRSHFPSAEELESALATGMIAGGVETWDRFAALLAGLATRRSVGPGLPHGARPRRADGRPVPVDGWSVSLSEGWNRQLTMNRIAPVSTFGPDEEQERAVEAECDLLDRARTAAGVHPDRGRSSRLGALLVDVDVRLMDDRPDVQPSGVWMPLKSAVLAEVEGVPFMPRSSGARPAAGPVCRR